MVLDRRNFLKCSPALGGALVFSSYLSGFQQIGADEKFDLVVYEGTSAAIIAATRKGRSVILVEPSNRLDGLTKGELGQTGIGIEEAIGGMTLEFYHRIGEYYKQDCAWEYQTWSE